MAVKASHEGHRWLQVLTLAGTGISPGAASAAAADAGRPRQLGAGSGQRGSHHYTVVLLLPSQVCCQLAQCARRLTSIFTVEESKYQPHDQR